MKKTKVVLAMVCAVLLVAASVMGTLAYLTSTATVTNTFTVGDNVVITLDEADVTELGELKYKEDGVTLKDRVTANTYKLLPGFTYVKDPTVHVTGESCYVYITVTGDISSVEPTTDSTYVSVATQITNNGWQKVDGYTNLYVYATGSDTKTAVSKTTNLPIFGSFTVDENVSYDTLNVMDKGSIEINAYAVQKDGFTGMGVVETFVEAFGDTTAATKTPAPEVDE